MAITFDPAKRERTLAERGLDFADAAEVLDGPRFQFVDDRRNYGERRITTIGLLKGRMVVLVWTRRGEDVMSSRCGRQRSVSRKDTQAAWVDPDDAPELTDEWFDKADFMVGDKVIRRGRPAGSSKQQVSLRLDKAVLDHFRATGPGWQTRMNDALRKAAGL